MLTLRVTIDLQKLEILSHLNLKSPTYYLDQQCVPSKIIHSVFFRTFVFLITEDKRTIIGKASFVKHIKYLKKKITGHYMTSLQCSR